MISHASNTIAKVISITLTIKREKVLASTKRKGIKSIFPTGDLEAILNSIEVFRKKSLRRGIAD